ncbi:MAG: hypothetical protein SFY95_04870, partial [Planctomycetota bacterium]|nr:hypothetical protein [Planctomycetota bacterium]
PMTDTPPSTPPSSSPPALIDQEALAREQRTSLLRIIRIVFLALFVTVLVLSILGVDPSQPDQGAKLVPTWYLTLFAGLGIGLVAVIADVLTPRKKISTLFSIFFGLLGAMLATVALSFVIELVARSYDINDEKMVGAIKVVIGMALAYLGISTVLQTQDDFRLVIPYVEFAKTTRGPRPMLLDSSALIDARLADVAATGIIQSPLIVPRFVVLELQTLADSQDKLRRGRGRRGLDVITRLQRLGTLDLTIDDSEPEPGAPFKGVDQQLVDLARRLSAGVVTTDSALARVAQISGVPVLNVHDLAAACKPMFVAGETLRIRLVRPGEQPGQAVGYLDDGTMVVAEDGEGALGQDVTLTATSTLQTSAGRLIFARLQTPPAPTAPPVPPPELTTEAPIADLAPAAQQVSPAEPETVANEPAPAPEPAPTAPRTGPYPPNPPRSLRAGSPRNPRR